MNNYTEAFRIVKKGLCEFNDHEIEVNYQTSKALKQLEELVKLADKGIHVVVAMNGNTIQNLYSNFPNVELSILGNATNNNEANELVQLNEASTVLERVC